MSTHGFVGDALIRTGVIDATNLARALETQAAKAVSPGRACAILGLADEGIVAATIASACHVEYVPGELSVDPKNAALLPAEFCRKRKAVAFGLQGNLLRLAVTDPTDYSVVQDVLMLTSESSVESETQGLAAGADDYIAKPAEPRRLAARVKALLGRASSNREAGI
jgi:hypothetical protein